MDVVCALIIDQNRILGTRRAHSSTRKGKWEFPGGKVKPGESPEKAIKREIDEELGISVSILHRLPDLVYDYPEFRIRLIPFLCKWDPGDIVLKDHDRFAWIPVDMLTVYEWSEADKNLILLIQDTTSYFNGPIV